ncbi:glycosyl hydrolase 53 family protein [Lactobacillus sp. ESL0785]|uniref:glycosyl hydrolase 53 family protein n=1 Tax=Lactobacillus sp. ESL0785 TaxID=2983232 RepID=UPI0023F70382|nr:glycosyl hydrolase 53 family protein [Lactobacillus sp. ESL0785]WEV71433.1 glycosyl hydrolase 53 family protein [Lactobacillus sp. ESL0785]
MNFIWKRKLQKDLQNCLHGGKLHQTARNLLIGTATGSILAGVWAVSNVTVPQNNVVYAAKNTKAVIEIKLKRTAIVYNHAGKRIAHRTFKKGKKLRVLATTIIKGKKFYRVGNGQYILAATATRIKGTKARAAKISKTTYLYTATGKKRQKIKKGTKVKVYGHKTINGKKYYLLSKDKYVLINKIKFLKTGAEPAKNPGANTSSAANNSAAANEPTNNGSVSSNPTNSSSSSTISGSTGSVSNASDASASSKPETPKNVEVYENGHWRLKDPTGKYLTGWQTIPTGPTSTKTVYYNADGMVYGEQRIAGNWYLFDKNTGAMQTGFQKVGHRIVYYATNGQMQYGWQTINSKKYFFDRRDGHQYQGKQVIDGTDYQFASDGSLITDLSKQRQQYREAVASDIAQEVQKQTGAKIDFDWNNQTDNYQAFTLHDAAQLVANQQLDNNPVTIEQNIKKNANLTGKLETSFITSAAPDFSVTSAQKVAQDFVATLTNIKDLDKTVLGVGVNSNSGEIAVLLFTPGAEPTPSGMVASDVQPIVVKVYKNSGINVDVTDGLQENQKLTAVDVGSLTNLADPFLLNGPKGQLIGEANLKKIFATLPGRNGKFVGIKNYFNGNDAYHYELWLQGQNLDQKQYNFIHANENTKYGDPLVIPYTATLVWGPAPGSSLDKTTKTQTEMTPDEIKQVYQTGTDSGLSQEKVNVQPIAGMKEDTIRGVDISSYLALKNAGVKFYDFTGKEVSLLKVLHDAGVNYIRLRLWNNPYNAHGQNYGGGIDDEATVLAIAKEAKQYGIKTALCFQYSDFWADPATQALPKAWEHETAAEIKQSIYNYTHKVLADFKAAGVDIGLVQAGNEITKGMLGILGSSKAVWGESDSSAQLAGYVNAASKAIRETYANALVTVQLETPNVDNYKFIMNSLKNNNVDYDVLGSSYYPLYGWNANNPQTLAVVEDLAVNQFGKKFVVLETAWPNSLNDADGTPNNIGYDPGHYAISPQGQVDHTAEMYKIIVNNPNGLGAFYWEPAWIPVKAGWDSWEYNKNVADSLGTGWANGNSQGYYPDSKLYYNGNPAWGGSSWDNNALFDDQGYPLQSLNMYNGFLTGYESK